MSGEENKVSTNSYKFIGVPEKSGWSCSLMGGEITITPTKGNEPNWFWRKMQYLCFGAKWTKK